MSIKISVVAPSSANLGDEVIESALQALKECGFELKLKDGYISKENPFHSNEDEFRAQHLYEELCSSDTSYVWCLKGGYGAGRLIPLLEKMPKPKLPKTIIGFSDITALHIFLSQKWGMNCIHGATISNSVRKEFNRQNFDDVVEFIKTGSKSIELDDISNLNNVATELEGEMVGGNLCIIDSSLGTSWQIQPFGKILFLEDVDERGYQLDRMLEHMRQVGIFNGVKGVLFGQFTGGKEKDGGDNTMFALNRFAKDASFPVFKTESIGHGFINKPFKQSGFVKINGNKYSALIN